MRVGVGVGVLPPVGGLFPLFPVLFPLLAVLFPLFPLFPALLPALAPLRLVLIALGVGVGVALLELGEVTIGGGGKPGAIVNSSKLRAPRLFCELLKLRVTVLLP